VITTFIVFGGPPVLSVFLPKLQTPLQRGRFLFTYIIIMFFMMSIVIGFFWFFPKLFELLLQHDFDMRNYLWFALLAFVVVISETLINAASGLMLINISAIARQMMRLVLLPIIAVLFFWKRNILIDYGMLCILGCFLVGYLAAVVICVLGISREQRFKMNMGWLLPQGYWAFSFSTMAVTIFSFFYGNFDRMAVLSIQDVQGLGLYQSVLSINTILERIPTLLLPTVIPTFSNLLGANHHDAFRKAFHILCRWAVVPVTVMSLVVMGFSHEILYIFGEQYAQYDYLLVLFGFVAIIRSLNLPSNVIKTCLEKNTFQFMQQFLMILFQCGLTLLFMPKYGVIAIAGTKILCVSISSIAGVLYVFYRLGMTSKLPLVYKSSLFAGIVMIIFHGCVDAAGWVASTVLTILCLMLFAVAARFSFLEVKSMIMFILRKETSLLSGQNN
jgi:O-antigen/teichoic acid export membrane protein